MTEHRWFRQSHVTTVSLLLTTAFKACILTAVGTAFAQHLWQLVRQRAYTIRSIEQFFQLRSSVVELGELQVILHAPFLVLMAVFAWLVPFAAIYPPSSLTISMHPFVEMRELEVPVLFPAQPEFDAWTPETTSGLRLSVVETIKLMGVNQTLAGRYSNSGPIERLNTLARSTALTGTIAGFSSPMNENMSYGLTFRGPQLSCNLETIDVLQAQDVMLPGGLNIYKIKWNRWDSTPNLTITSLASGLEWYPFNATSQDSYVLPWQSPNSSVTYLGNVSILTCHPISVIYDLVLSYSRNTRNVSFTKRDPKALTRGVESVDLIMSRNISEIDEKTTEAKKWAEEVKAALPNWNIFALLDASLAALSYSCFDRIQGTVSGPMILPNGTEVLAQKTAAVDCRRESLDSALLDTSVFNPGRFVAVDQTADPTRFDLSEHMLNEYITNVTISAMSLNIGTVKTPVNITEYRTVYDFSAPLSLIIPYSLCLLFGIFFVGIGIWSLNRNGVPAIDGGFLQVMSTTTGRTMEALAVSHQRSLDDGYRPKGLLDLEVRYGELVDDAGVGTGVEGFGTVEETKVLRRR
ncbi:hypothetical protein B0J11DRAFT_438407 [Dendryphion nanum]|uniref:Uncharacterized protein n=1 Tax=Dendryphion nanum TaxID=256645 RepID=A0A9P9DKX0_9PLEO|nr:hypothetical protein B0J11DRAFT_438407 [Dendryphion nanum]